MKTNRIRQNGSAPAAAQQCQNRQITLTLSPAHYAYLKACSDPADNGIEVFCQKVLANFIDGGRRPAGRAGSNIVPPHADEEARRQELAVDIFTSHQQNTLQALADYVASGFEFAPIAPQEREETDEEIQSFLAARSRELLRLEAEDRPWFEQFQDEVDAELPCRICGPEGDAWRARLAVLGLGMQDLIREASVCLLVDLKATLSNATMNAGGAK